MLVAFFFCSSFLLMCELIHQMAAVHDDPMNFYLLKPSLFVILLWVYMMVMVYACFCQLCFDGYFLAELDYQRLSVCCLCVVHVLLVLRL